MSFKMISKLLCSWFQSPNGWWSCLETSERERTAHALEARESYIEISKRWHPHFSTILQAIIAAENTVIEPRNCGHKRLPHRVARNLVAEVYKWLQGTSAKFGVEWTIYPLHRQMEQYESVCFSWQGSVTEKEIATGESSSQVSPSLHQLGCQVM